MKLDWEINEFRVLKAKVGEVTYYVAPGAIDLWRPHKQYAAFDGKAATVWPVEGGMSLTNAIAWCERDVDRPEGCPAQPPAADPVAPKTSGPASKFPSTLDAKSWAVRLKMHNTPESLYSVSQLTEWFQAALSFGYEEGRKAGASRTMTVSQYLAWQQTNAAPPSPEAAPPCPEDLIESFDARVWASEFMRRNSGLPSPFISSHVQVDKDTMITWFSNALMRGYDERRGQEPKDSPAPEPPSVEERLKVMEETDSMHCRLMETYDRHANDLEKRLDALEERAKWSPDSRLVEERLKELRDALEDMHANLKVVQAVGVRTETDLDLPSRERTQVNPGLDAAVERIEKLEARTRA